MEKNNIDIKSFFSKNYKDFKLIDLELLICFVLNKDRSFLVTNDNYIFTANELKTLNSLLEKRRENYSVALLVWTKEFYWRSFIVNEDTLIPRPETEILIEQVLLVINKSTSIKLLDIWTWTWAIPITISLETNMDVKLDTTASDISLKALNIAKQNAKQLWVSINFIHSDLFENIKESNFDIITSNLPYVPLKDKNETIEKEPDIALYSWEDWLDHYKLLAKELKSNNINFDFLFLEIAPFQSEQIKNIYSEFWKIEIIKDLAGKDRIVKVEKNH